MRLSRLRSVLYLCCQRSLATRFGFHPYRFGLGVKLFVMVAGISLIGVFSSSALVLHLHYRQLVDLETQLTDTFWRVGLASLLMLGLLAGATLVVLKTVGHEIQSAIDNALSLAEAQRRERETVTSKQVRYLATLEERDRLARELHDNLAQMLGYLNVKTCIIKHHLAHDEVKAALTGVLELEKLTDEVYTEVRETIFSLRTMASSGWELIPTLREYLEVYRKHYGIDTQLILADESCHGLDAEVQVQINRIIQEALTNVRKHSGASRAWVKFERQDHSVRISVEDDGHGFDSAHLTGEGPEHFGLQIMRERAAGVGARLEIDSGLEAGTRVVLQVPLLCPQEESA